MVPGHGTNKFSTFFVVGTYCSRNAGGTYITEVWYQHIVRTYSAEARYKHMIEIFYYEATVLKRCTNTVLKRATST